ncbi:Hint domain-containing protein [Rhodobacteraceae bacterium]|nr:Hint domain-containing protein [Paracoccaceae bacterium]
MLDPTAATPPICFAAGTMIDTAHGARAIETLVAGDLVMTKDHGARPIRWIGSTAFTAQALAARENLRPIRIAAGALGDNRPATDLTVSRQHRVLVRSRVAERMFGSAEALVPAKDLLGMPGVAIVNDAEGVCYFHMLFDAHEVVFSNGLETESLHTGPEAIKSLSPAAVTEIFTLFPELREDAGRPMARVVAAGRSARQMVARHVKNDKPLVAVVQ